MGEKGRVIPSENNVINIDHEITCIAIVIVKNRDASALTKSHREIS